MVFKYLSFVFVVLICYTSTSASDDLLTQLLSQVTQQQAESILGTQSIARKYVIQTLTDVRNRIIRFSGYHTTMENIVKGLQTRKLEPLKIVKDWNFFKSTGSSNMRQLAKIIYRMQGCSEATDYTISKWEAVLNTIPEISYHLTPIQALNITDAEYDIVDKLDRPFVEFVLISLYYNKLNLTNALLQDILENYAFDPYSPDLVPLIRNVNNRLASETLGNIVLQASAGRWMSEDVSSATLKKILSSILTQTNLESQFDYQIEMILSALESNILGLSGNEDDSVEGWLLAMREGDYPEDILHTRNELMGMIGNGSLLTKEELNTLKEDMTGYSSSGRVLGLLARLLVVSPSEPVAAKIHALYSHVKLRQLALSEKYFIPHSSDDISLLLNSFLTVKNRVDFPLVRQINEIFSSPHFDWNALYQDFDFSKYSDPRRLLLAMLRHIGHNHKLQLCSVLVINYFLQQNTDNCSASTPDTVHQQLNGSRLPIVPVWSTGEENSAGAMPIGLPKNCRNGPPVRVVDPDCLIEIMDSKQHAGFITDLIKYNPAAAEKFPYNTRYGVFNAILADLKTNKYTDDVSEFVISQAMLRLPLNEKANFPPTYKLLCPEEIVTLLSHAPTTQAPDTIELTKPPTFVSTPVTPPQCDNTTRVINRDSLWDVVNNTHDWSRLRHILFAEPVFYGEYSSLATKATVLVAVLERRIKDLNRVDLVAELTSFSLLRPFTLEGQHAPDVVFLCNEKPTAVETFVMSTETVHYQSATEIPPIFTTSIYTNTIQNLLNAETRSTQKYIHSTQTWTSSEVCKPGEDLTLIVDTDALLNLLSPEAPKARFLRNRIRSYVIPVTPEMILTNETGYPSADILRYILDTIKDEMKDATIAANMEILKSYIQLSGPGSEPPATSYACIPKNANISEMRYQSRFEMKECPQRMCTPEETVAAVIDTDSLFDALRPGAWKNPQIADRIRVYIMPVDASKYYKKGDVLRSVLRDLLNNVNDTVLQRDVNTVLNDISTGGAADERPRTVSVCFRKVYIGSLVRSPVDRPCVLPESDHVPSSSRSPSPGTTPLPLYSLTYAQSVMTDSTLIPVDSFPGLLSTSDPPSFPPVAITTNSNPPFPSVIQTGSQASNESISSSSSTDTNITSIQTGNTHSVADTASSVFASSHSSPWQLHLDTTSTPSVTYQAESPSVSLEDSSLNYTVPGQGLVTQTTYPNPEMTHSGTVPITSAPNSPGPYAVAMEQESAGVPIYSPTAAPGSIGSNLPQLPYLYVPYSTLAGGYPIPQTAETTPPGSGPSVDSAINMFPLPTKQYAPSVESSTPLPPAPGMVVDAGKPLQYSSFRPPPVALTVAADCNGTNTVPTGMTQNMVVSVPSLLFHLVNLQPNLTFAPISSTADAALVVTNGTSTTSEFGQQNVLVTSYKSEQPGLSGTSLLVAALQNQTTAHANPLVSVQVAAHPGVLIPSKQPLIPQSINISGYGIQEQIPYSPLISTDGIKSSVQPIQLPYDDRPPAPAGGPGVGVRVNSSTSSLWQFQQMTVTYPSNSLQPINPEGGLSALSNPVFLSTAAEALNTTGNSSQAAKQTLSGPGPTTVAPISPFTTQHLRISSYQPIVARSTLQPPSAQIPIGPVITIPNISASNVDPFHGQNASGASQYISVEPVVPHSPVSVPIQVSPTPTGADVSVPVDSAITPTLLTTNDLRISSDQSVKSVITQPEQPLPIAASAAAVEAHSGTNINLAAGQDIHTSFPLQPALSQSSATIPIHVLPSPDDAVVVAADAGKNINLPLDQQEGTFSPTQPIQPIKSKASASIPMQSSPNPVSTSADAAVAADFTTNINTSPNQDISSSSSNTASVMAVAVASDSATNANLYPGQNENILSPNQPMYPTAAVSSDSITAEYLPIPVPVGPAVVVAANPESSINMTPVPNSGVSPLINSASLISPEIPVSSTAGNFTIKSGTNATETPAVIYQEHPSLDLPLISQPEIPVPSYAEGMFPQSSTEPKLPPRIDSNGHPITTSFSLLTRPSVTAHPVIYQTSSPNLPHKIFIPQESQPSVPASASTSQGSTSTPLQETTPGSIMTMTSGASGHTTASASLEGNYGTLSTNSQQGNNPEGMMQCKPGEELTKLISTSHLLQLLPQSPQSPEVTAAIQNARILANNVINQTNADTIKHILNDMLVKSKDSDVITTVKHIMTNLKTEEALLKPEFVYVCTSKSKSCPFFVSATLPVTNNCSNPRSFVDVEGLLSVLSSEGKEKAKQYIAIFNGIDLPWESFSHVNKKSELLMYVLGEMEQELVRKMSMNATEDLGNALTQIIFLKGCILKDSPLDTEPRPVIRCSVQTCLTSSVSRQRATQGKKKIKKTKIIYNSNESLKVLVRVKKGSEGETSKEVDTPHKIRKREKEKGRDNITNVEDYIMATLVTETTEVKPIQEVTEIYYNPTEAPKLASIVLTPSNTNSSVAYMHPLENASLSGYYELLKWPILLKPEGNHSCYDNRNLVYTSPVLVINITSLFDVINATTASELDEYLTATYLTSLDTYFKLAFFEFENHTSKEEFLRDVLQYLLRSEERHEIAEPMKRILDMIPKTTTPLQLGALCNYRIYEELPKRTTPGNFTLCYVSSKPCQSGVISYEVTAVTDADPPKKVKDNMETFSQMASRNLIFENVQWEKLATQSDFGQLLINVLQPGTVQQSFEDVFEYLQRKIPCKLWKTSQVTVKTMCYPIQPPPQQS